MEISKPDYTYLWSSGGSIVAPSNVKIQTGWTAEVPPFQWENWSQNRQDAAISHILQKGISVWSSTGEYYFTISGERSYVQGSDGSIYVAVADSVGQNPILDASNTYWTPAFRDSIAAHGQCRLAATSAIQIRLSPLNGNGLSINGTRRAVPSAGVNLSNSGLAASTLYYIYAAWSGSTMSLEASTTGHSADTATGIEIKTGDVSRTLVGMVYTDASSQFSDGPTSRLVASYFNRRSVGSSITTSGVITFTTVLNTEIATSVRLLFLTWANEAVDISLTGQNTNNTATQSVSVQSYVDGAAYGNLSATYISAAGQGYSYASSNSLTPAGAYLAEGFHTAQVFGSVTANTGSTTTMSHSLITRI